MCRTSFLICLFERASIRLVSLQWCLGQTIVSLSTYDKEHILLQSPRDVEDMEDDHGCVPDGQALVLEEGAWLFTNHFLFPKVLSKYSHSYTASSFSPALIWVSLLRREFCVSCISVHHGGLIFLRIVGTISLIYPYATVYHLWRTFRSDAAAIGFPLRYNMSTVGFGFRQRWSRRWARRGA